MTLNEACDKITASFPTVKVHPHEGLFTQGLGVEFMRDGVPVRNACIVKHDNWIEAADLLIGWLQREQP